MATEHEVAIGVVVFDAVEERDFISAYEVLMLAVRRGAAARIGLYSTTGSLELTGANGLRFHADAPLGTDPLEAVIVPGGVWSYRGNGRTWDEVQRGWLPRTLAELHARGTVVASVSAGRTLLAAAGLEEDDVVTSGGVFAGIDLGLRLVERFFGPKIRTGLETEVEYERRGPNWASRPTTTERSG